MDKYNQKWVMMFAQKDAANWAITLGQSTYYSVPWIEVDVKWRKHEDKHKEQWAREGTVKFAIKYLWYLARYGYERSPYEVEARAAERT